MKKLIIVGAILFSGIVAVSAMTMSSSSNNVTSASSSNKGPTCRLFTDPCPDGSVGYHCAYNGPSSLPVCKLTKTGMCAQIWPCGTTND